MYIFSIKEVTYLNEPKYITIISNRKKIVLNINSILYIIMIGKNAEIHISKDEIYKTRMSFGEIQSKLDDSFIKVNRGCIVSARAIHNITDNVNLNNGESLVYTVRKKKEIINQIHQIQKNIIDSFSDKNIPSTEEEYKKYYSSFENMPFAFTDIEMIFDKEKHAIDWIFRYGNSALAKLEKTPLEKLIGNSFGSIFSNMDSKWLKSYERATLYGETLEIVDYSPEIDTYLKVICFPTFKGHCGCILFDISNIKYTQNSNDSQKCLMMYLGDLINKA